MNEIVKKLRELIESLNGEIYEERCDFRTIAYKMAKKDYTAYICVNEKYKVFDYTLFYKNNVTNEVNYGGNYEDYDDVIKDIKNNLL